MTSIFIGGLAIIAILAIGWLAANVRSSRHVGSLQAEAAAHSARATQFAEQLAKTNHDLSIEREKNAELNVRLAASETDRTNLRTRLEEEAQHLKELQTQFSVAFENLANRILEEKSEKFLAKNQEHLGLLLDPLRQRLSDFRERIETIHTEETKTTAALREQLQQIKDLNKQMTDEAGALARALKGESKTQGLWGELILERILEKSGLKKGEEYETQTLFRNAEGQSAIPDVIIRLPEGKNIIIDAKVSLLAYERSINAENDSVRQTSLREHVLSVRRHAEELAKKDYPGLPDLQSPDFILMFVPIEPALHAALQQDPALYGDTFEKNVILVSSSTLLIALRTVESVWRRHKQTLNAIEIARHAGSLHDQFVLFLEAMQEIGQRLDQARTSYDQALARLSTGRGNLVRRVKELEKLGARAEKHIPPPLLQQSIEEEEK